MNMNILEWRFEIGIHSAIDRRRWVCEIGMIQLPMQTEQGIKEAAMQ